MIRWMEGEQKKMRGGLLSKLPKPKGEREEVRELDVDEFDEKKERETGEDEFEEINFFDSVEIEVLEEDEHIGGGTGSKEDIGEKEDVEGRKYVEEIVGESREIPEGAQSEIDREKKRKNIIIKEISQEDILKDIIKHKTLDVKSNIGGASSKGYIPSVSMKRKHNIMSLAYESKQNADSLEEARSYTKAMRKVMRKQYGF